jgi:hypothetical protein
MPDLKSLKIVHVTRTPVGGIFRHILDVASGQAARGHHVGIVCDSTTGGARAEAALAAIAPQMKLGIARFAMQRELGPADLMGFVQVSRHRAALHPDVLHGHGAKGGAFVRLSPARSAIRVYTPHGGSLHYGRHTLRGMVYGTIERFLSRPHRAVPVRKRVRPQRLRGDRRPAARRRARGVQRHQHRRDGAGPAESRRCRHRQRRRIPAHQRHRRAARRRGRAAPVRAARDTRRRRRR